MKHNCAYIMANDRPTLYTGVTSSLAKRVYEHKNDNGSDFTKKYKLHKLVYFEWFETIKEAIVREKQIKDMNRNDKIDMIKKLNPNFKDLYTDIIKY